MKHGLLLLTLLLLHGCTVLDSLNSETSRIERVDEYLADQEFSRALTFIADTPDNDPEAVQLAKKRKVILNKLKTFEQQTVTTALKQERSCDWPGAKLTYKEALEKLNNSSVLEEEQESMLKRFQDRMTALKHEELIVTGEWLKKKLPLQRSLHESDPESIGIHWRYSRTEGEAKELGQELLKAGEQMLAENNLAMAHRLLPLAVELAPGPESDAAVNRLNNELKKRTSKKQESRHRITQKKNALEIEAFNKAMALRNLKEARQHLSRLDPTLKKSTAVELMQERLDTAISRWVQEEISIGNSFYRAGEYEQALKTWQNILGLVPDHEAVLTKIDRTQKIIEQLSTLEKRQQQH